MAQSYPTWSSGLSWDTCFLVLFYKCLFCLTQQGQGVVVVPSLSRLQLFVTPWTAACQASLSFNVFWSLLKLISIDLVMPSNHLILCTRPLPSTLSPPDFNLSQNQVLFERVGSSHQEAKVLELQLQHQPFQ